MHQIEDQRYLTSDDAARLQDQLIIQDAARTFPEEIEVTNERSLTRSVDDPQQYLSMAYDAISCGIIVLDALTQVVEANKTAQQLPGLSLDEMQHLLAADVLTPFTHLDGTPLSPEELPHRVALHTGNAQHDKIEGFIPGRTAPCYHGQRVDIVLPAKS